MKRKARFHLNSEPVEEPLINLTPLIDVVFVVLITFILIAPMLEIDSVDLATSSSPLKKDLKSSSLAIHVHRDNSIYFKGNKITLPNLKKILLKEKQENPTLIPQIIHDKKAEFGTYQSLKSCLESLGFEKMDVVLKPE